MSTRIIDVRLSDSTPNGEANVHDEIAKGLSRPFNEKFLPTVLLYDEEGLRVYDDLATAAKEYYLFPAEENLLKNNAHDIANIISSRSKRDHQPVESVVLELGAGALRKTSHLLSALSKIVPEQKTPAPITYYALDLERRELERTLDELAASPVGLEMQGKVDTRGLWGTFEGGLKFVAEGGLRGRETARAAAISLRSRSPSSDGVITQPSPTGSSSEQGSIETAPSTPDASLETPLHVLFLGSTLGMFLRGEDAAFLNTLPLRGDKGDTLLIGIDMCRDIPRIERAYNDTAGVSRRFILNGLKSAGRALGDESLFPEEKWEYKTRFNVEEQRHEAFVCSRIAQTVRDPLTGTEFAFVEGERVRTVMSHKFNEEAVSRLFTEANLRPLRYWTDADSGYSLWLLERPPAKGSVGTDFQK